VRRIARRWSQLGRKGPERTLPRPAIPALRTRVGQTRPTRGPRPAARRPLSPIDAPRDTAGFSLIELLVTVSVVAILVLIAVPQLDDAALTRKLAAQIGDFLSTLQLARSESMKRNARVVVCKSSNKCDCAVSGGYEQGWIMFRDDDADGVRDHLMVCGSDEPSAEPILEVHPPLPNGFSLTGTEDLASYISFHPSGQALLATGGTQTGTFTLCRLPPSTSGNGREITVNAAGRLRVVEVDDLTTCP